MLNNFTDVENKMKLVVKDFLYDIMSYPDEWVNAKMDTVLQMIAEETLDTDYEKFAFDPQYDKIEEKVCKPISIALNSISAVYAE